MRSIWPLFLLLLPTLIRAETIRILNWDAYLAPEVQTQWEKRSGNTLEVIKFDNDEGRDALLLNAKKHKIDIAVVDEIIAKRFGSDGKFVEISEENLPSLKHMGSFWRDRCGQYAVPYLWGTLGIIYRSDIVKTPPTSWQELIKPKDALKGHIGMLNDHTDMLAPALFLEGYSLNTDNITALKHVFELLKQQTEFVLTYEYPLTFLETAKNADQLHMAVAYGGDQKAINENLGQQGLWQYVVPKEGTIMWVDCLAISADSEYIEESLAFIEFLNQPEIAAKNAHALFYATPNEAAVPFLPKDFRNNRAVFPDKATQSRSDLYQELTNDNIKQRLRITNAIVNIHESKQTR